MTSDPPSPRGRSRTSPLPARRYHRGPLLVGSGPLILLDVVFMAVLVVLLVVYVLLEASWWLARYRAGRLRNDDPDSRA